MRRLLALVALLLLAACDEMGSQPRYDSAEKSTLFPDGKSLQAAPAGAVAQDQPAFDKALAERPPMSAALIERGAERYAIACVPCHGAAGDGRGTVPARGYPRPPSFFEDAQVAMPSRHIVDVITNGYGVMYALYDRVAPADRWAIAAYVRALQLSRNVPAAALSPADRAALGG